MLPLRPPLPVHDPALHSPLLTLAKQMKSKAGHGCCPLDCDCRTLVNALLLAKLSCLTCSLVMLRMPTSTVCYQELAELQGSQGRACLHGDPLSSYVNALIGRWCRTVREQGRGTEGKALLPVKCLRFHAPTCIPCSPPAAHERQPRPAQTSPLRSPSACPPARPATYSSSADWTARASAIRTPRATSSDGTDGPSASRYRIGDRLQPRRVDGLRQEAQRSVCKWFFVARGAVSETHARSTCTVCKRVCVINAACSWAILWRRVRRQRTSNPER